MFIDKATLADQPEEDWMKIDLKPDAVLESQGRYSASERDKKSINEIFDDHHRTGKMAWAGPSTVAWPVFVVWNGTKGCVAIDIRGFTRNVWKDPYPCPRQDEIVQAIKSCFFIPTFDLPGAFLQRLLAMQDRWKVTVVTHRGLEMFCVTPLDM